MDEQKRQRYFLFDNKIANYNNSTVMLHFPIDIFVIKRNECKI